MAKITILIVSECEAITVTYISTLGLANTKEAKFCYSQFAG